MMGKIVYLMGKSSTGKDTIFRELYRSTDLKLNMIVPYTTRPIRIGETDGLEYFFTDEATYQEIKKSGKVVEERAYNTCHGLWRYYTVDDGNVDLMQNSYIIIGTLEAYLKMKEYYGVDKLIPVMIELDDGVRLQRALNREKKQQEPKYEEMCRRYLADSEDFSEEKLLAAGITRRFKNDNLRRCINEIKEYIKSQS